MFHYLESKMKPLYFFKNMDFQEIYLRHELILVTNLFLRSSWKLFKSILVSKTHPLCILSRVIFLYSKFILCFLSCLS